MNISEITTGTANSPSDLIDLEESLRQPRSNQPRGIWAFRGQSQAFGTLVPSFQRIFRQKQSVGAAEIIERDLIATFRKHYAEIDGKTFDMPYPESIGTDYDLRCLSVMQHYGVPTRLLDWTSDFWTAIYFACASDTSKDAELWMYDRGIFNMQTISRPDLATLLQPSGIGIKAPPEPDILSRSNGSLIVELDPHITPRMKRQLAHHTLSSDVFADHVPLLFNLAEQTQLVIGTQGIFRRVLIAAPCKEKTLRFLAEQKSLNAGTIFPDVEGLGRFLHWHLETLMTTLL